MRDCPAIRSRVWRGWIVHGYLLSFLRRAPRCGRRVRGVLDRLPREDCGVAAVASESMAAVVRAGWPGSRRECRADDGGVHPGGEPVPAQACEDGGSVAPALRSGPGPALVEGLAVDSFGGAHAVQVGGDAAQVQGPAGA